MITLHFHWIWIIVTIIVICGISIAGFLMRQAKGVTAPIFGLIGLLIIVIAVLIALVLLGIFVW